MLRAFVGRSSCAINSVSYSHNRRFHFTTTRANEQPASSSPSLSSIVPGAAFVSAMFSPPPNIHLTENQAFTHESSLDARLDLFFQLVPTIEKDHAIELFEKSWAQSPADTLKLIFHAGSVRHGKSDKKSFLNGLWWLTQKHPATLIHNLQYVPQTGYWKDLLELLRRINIGEEEFAKGFDLRKKTKYKNYDLKKKAKKARRAEYISSLEALPDDDARAAAKAARRLKFEEQTKKGVEHAKQLRMKVARNRVERSIKCREDDTYAKVEQTVAKLFADQIGKDFEQLNSSAKKDISLAGKWAPSFGRSFDKYTGISLLILSKLLGRPVSPSDLLEKRVSTHKSFQNFLTPLRKYIQIPESYMSSNKWDSLPYNRVPSVAMKQYKKLFMKHDNDRFVAYLEEIKNSKNTERVKQLASGALLPHQILVEALATQNDTNLNSVSELQWQSYVARLAKDGKLNNIMPVCDVSGSMASRVDKHTTNLQVSTALSLLIAELASPPFKDLICTFSARPMFHRVTGSTLAEKYNNLAKADWGTNTNYQAVFDLILAQAIAHKLPEDQMIKRIVVLSDMEFDSSCNAKHYQTDHMLAELKFEQAGYKLPEIIYWNLAARRNPASVPATKNTPGVSLISGFSGNLLRLFMENPEGSGEVQQLEAIGIMEKAISHEQFASLKVLD